MFCTKCGTKNEAEAKFCSECGSKIAGASTNAPRLDPIEGFKIEQNFRYAGFWYRVFAYIIDFVIVNIAVIFIMISVVFVLRLLLLRTDSISAVKIYIGLLFKFAFLIVTFFYFTISESSSWQATFGKKLLGLKVIDLEGHPITSGQADARYWSKILSMIILGIGFIMVAFTKKKQGLHDKIAGTLVVKI